MYACDNHWDWKYLPLHQLSFSMVTITKTKMTKRMPIHAKEMMICHLDPIILAEDYWSMKASCITIWEDQTQREAFERMSLGRKITTKTNQWPNIMEKDNQRATINYEWEERHNRIESKVNILKIGSNNGIFGPKAYTNIRNKPITLHQSGKSTISPHQISPSPTN